MLFSVTCRPSKYIHRDRRDRTKILVNFPMKNLVEISVKFGRWFMPRRWRRGALHKIQGLCGTLGMPWEHFYDSTTRLVAWSTAQALLGCKLILEKSRVLPFILLLLACSFWNFVCRFRSFHVQWEKWPKPRWVSVFLSAGLFGENCVGRPPSAGPRSKASSALILKLLSASQQTSHENKKT